MAKMNNIGKRVLALVLALVLCFSATGISAHAAVNERGNWTYAYYLGQEYLGNKSGAAVKPDPVGYGFQGVITSLTFQDDEGTSWTFNWNSTANGEWRITGSNVTKAKASDWPVITQDKEYVGYCGSKAYTFTLTDDGKAAGWTYVNDSNRHVNWFYYIRFIREYTVNVFYQNATGSVTYKGVQYAAQEPLVRYFQFLYPNGNIIDDSEYKDGEYTDPTTLWPADYLPQAMKDQGYELKYATNAKGEDVMATGVTISLLGENILNVYCTLIPPKTENYNVVHKYYTDNNYDGSQAGGTVEVQENADFAQIVSAIAKQTVYNGNTYSYIRYTVDPAKKVIELVYTRVLPTYDYALTYNANFGENPETKADSENVTGIHAESHSIQVNTNSFERPNYSFIGWNTRADGKGTAYAAGDTVALTAQNNTAVLYAQWQEHPKYDYSLIYNANFGANQTVSDAENVAGTYATSHSIGVDTNSFSRPNYSFIGWNTRADGRGTAYAAGDTVALTAQNNTVVLYAQWQENPKYNYALFYNANFGTVPETKADSENVIGTYSATYGIKVDSNSFVRPNHTFIGWNTRADGKGVDYPVGATVELDARNNNTVLYAQWKEHPKYDYRLIYNANFGANQTAADAENVAGTYAISHKIRVDENKFSRANYIFTGWNTRADGKGISYSAGATVTLNTLNNTAVLYAQWKENPKYSYSLVYNANYGAVPATKSDSENVTGIYATSHSIAVDSNSFNRVNYTFIGWNTRADGKGTDYAAGQTVNLTAQNNTAVLYAQWEENTKYDYEVKYNANFGLFPATEQDAENLSNTYAVEHSIEVDANSFKRNNYTFLGWSETRDGPVVYAAGDLIRFVMGGKKTLYAQWLEHDKYGYTVIYNGNGGALEDGAEAYGDAENLSGTYAQSHEITVDENGFIRPNYTFVGWNTEADGTGTVYSAEDVIALQAQNNSLTLYAQWQENAKYDYTVFYSANFGEEPEIKADAQNVSGIYEVLYQIEVDENGFEREGYTFTGWNTQFNGEGKAYAAGEQIALTAQENTAVLYAQWIINEYEYKIEYVVRVDDGDYVPFEGELPEGAPTGGTVPYGTVLNEETLEGIPAQITDDVHTYEFTEVEGIEIPFGSNTVIVYYTYVTPEEPVVPPTEPEEPTVAPTEPEESTEAPTQPEEPTVAPTQPEEPTVAPTQPEEPTVAPTQPEEPTVAPTQPEEPTVAPTQPEEPTVAPTQPDAPTAPPAVEQPTAPPVVDIPDEEVPLAPVPPVVDIPDEEVPLAPVPPVVDIPDEEVPLASVPKTGDPIVLYAGMGLLSGLGLLGLKGKKKEEEET